MPEPGVDAPREFRELVENPKAVVGHSSGLAAEAKVNLNADSCSS